VNESRAYIIMSIKGQTRGVSGVDRMCGETCVFGRVVPFGDDIRIGTYLCKYLDAEPSVNII